MTEGWDVYQKNWWTEHVYWLCNDEEPVSAEEQERLWGEYEGE